MRLTRAEGLRRDGSIFFEREVGGYWLEIFFFFFFPVVMWGTRFGFGNEGGEDILLIGRRTKVGLAHEQKPMSSVSLSPDSQ